MRKTYYNIIGAVCVACGLTSCADFLEIKPQNEIIMEDFWNEKADVDNILAGCYSAMLGDGIRKRMMIWGEARSDNMMSGENINNDINLYNVVKENLTAMNSYTTWDGFYDIINRCNTVLKYAPGVAAIDPAYTDGDLRATIAEASALRDLCYFYLIRTFRDVPYSTEAFTDDDQKMDLPATPFETVLSYLIEDLESVKGDAVTHYPEDKPRYQTGRITRDAIYAMLCEMYLWKKDYDNCVKYAELVIQSKKNDYEEEKAKGNNDRSSRLGGNQTVIETRLNGYPLVNDYWSNNANFGQAYERIFVEGCSRETIFELSYNDDPASGGTNNSAISSFFGHSNARVGFLAASTAVTEDMEKTSGRKIFEDVNGMLDGRIYQSCDPDGGGIVKYVAKSLSINATSANRTSAPTWSYSSYAENNNGSKWIIYRLPDIMLLEAEALCQKMQEGSDSAINVANLPLREKVFSLVNAINKRAILKATLTDADTLKFADYSTKSLMENLVKRERQRELMFEGKRWYDLVRYCMRNGNTDEIISATASRDDVNSSFVQSFFRKMDAIFWPYNNEEMKVNKNLVPNSAFGTGENSSYERTK